MDEVRKLFILTYLLFSSCEISAWNLVGLEISSNGTMYWNDKYETSLNLTQYTSGHLLLESSYNQGDILALMYFDQHFEVIVENDSWVVCQYRPFDL